MKKFLIPMFVAMLSVATPSISHAATADIQRELAEVASNPAALAQRVAALIRKGEAPAEVVRQALQLNPGAQSIVIESAVEAAVKLAVDAGADRVAATKTAVSGIVTAAVEEGVDPGPASQAAVQGAANAGGDITAAVAGAVEGGGDSTTAINTGIANGGNPAQLVAAASNPDSIGPKTDGKTDPTDPNKEFEDPVSG